MTKILGETVSGLNSRRTEYDFSLVDAEIQDLVNMVAYTSRTELEREQSEGNLKESVLTFNKGMTPKIHGSEYKAKLGTSFAYTQPNKTIYELTRYAEQIFDQIVDAKITPRSHRYENSNSWVKNGIKIIPSEDMSLYYGEQLILFNKTHYAKYLEFKKTQNHNKGIGIFWVLAGRIKREFGRFYYIERVVVDGGADRYPGVSIKPRKQYSTKIGK
ncbi:MAG: hypothetical protein KZQ83_17735 [gamma proteobacterium symbiont of Taylorina sp.]|nr:hypothetical protein [gamma proteobacterium symbiont of Taylorina sp.]